jgi:hypothetical protein
MKAERVVGRLIFFVAPSVNKTVRGADELLARFFLLVPGDTPHCIGHVTGL